MISDTTVFSVKVVIGGTNLGLVFGRDVRGEDDERSECERLEDDAAFSEREEVVEEVLDLFVLLLVLIVMVCLLLLSVVLLMVDG